VSRFEARHVEYPARAQIKLATDDTVLCVYPMVFRNPSSFLEFAKARLSWLERLPQVDDRGVKIWRRPHV